MMWEKDTVEHYTRIMLEEDAAAGSPLVQAARAGRADEVAALLADGADANIRDGGWAPIILATVKGHTDVVRALVAASDLACKGSALVLACAFGFADIATLLRRLRGVCRPPGRVSVEPAEPQALPAPDARTRRQAPARRRVAVASGVLRRVRPSGGDPRLGGVRDAARADGREGRGRGGPQYAPPRASRLR